MDKSEHFLSYSMNVGFVVLSVFTLLLQTNSSFETFPQMEGKLIDSLI